MCDTRSILKVKNRTGVIKSTILSKFESEINHCLTSEIRAVLESNEFIKGKVVIKIKGLFFFYPPYNKK